MKSRRKRKGALAQSPFKGLDGVRACVLLIASAERACGEDRAKKKETKEKKRAPSPTAYVPSIRFLIVSDMLATSGSTSKVSSSRLFKVTCRTHRNPKAAGRETRQSETKTGKKALSQYRSHSPVHEAKEEEKERSGEGRRASSSPGISLTLLTSSSSMVLFLGFRAPCSPLSSSFDESDSASE